MTTNEWSVFVGAAAGKGQRRVPKMADRSGLLVDGLIGRGGVATTSRDGRRYGARFCVEAPGPVEALQKAMTVFREAAAAAGLPAWDVVEVEVQTEAGLERQNAEPSLPELVGVGEVAELLDVTRQRASALASTPGFPAPLVTLRSGPVWTRASVDRFVQSWRRRPGRTPVKKPPARIAPPALAARGAAQGGHDDG